MSGFLNSLRKAAAAGGFQQGAGEGDTDGAVWVVISSRGDACQVFAKGLEIVTLWGEGLIELLVASLETK